MLSGHGTSPVVRLDQAHPPPPGPTGGDGELVYLHKPPCRSAYVRSRTDPFAFGKAGLLLPIWMGLAVQNMGSNFNGPS